MELVFQVTKCGEAASCPPLEKRFGQSGGTIGRAACDDLVLADPNKHISKLHASVRCERGTYFLKHKGANATHVNGNSLEHDAEVMLRDGDEVSIGDYVLSVSLAPEANVAADAPQVAEEVGNNAQDLATDDYAAGYDIAQQHSRLLDGLSELPEPEAQHRVTPGFRGSEPDKLPEIEAPLPRMHAVTEAIPSDLDILAELGIGSPKRSTTAPSVSARVAEVIPAIAVKEEIIPDRLDEPEIPSRSAGEKPSLCEGTPSKPNAQAAGESTSHDPTVKDVLVAALLQGAGLEDLELPAGFAEEFMRKAGLLLLEYTSGTLKVLQARAAIKNELRGEQTVFHTNPLKVSPDASFALEHLLGPKSHGFMSGVDAIQEAFRDLCAHEMAVMAGLRAALAGVLRRFDPKAVEKRLGTDSLLDEILPHSHKAKAWETFVALHHEMTAELEDDFDTLFGKEFRRAYEDQVRRLAEAARNRSAVAK